jgi:hypothetical protein
MDKPNTATSRLNFIPEPSPFPNHSVSVSVDESAALIAQADGSNKDYRRKGGSL